MNLGYSGAMDVILALFPWFIIWKLSMTKKEKCGVAIAMSMGVVYDDSPQLSYVFPSRKRYADRPHSAGVTSFVKAVKLPQLAGDPGNVPHIYIALSQQGRLLSSDVLVQWIPSP